MTLVAGPGNPNKSTLAARGKRSHRARHPEKFKQKSSEKVTFGVDQKVTKN